MRINYILAALSIAAILVISGCASPSPSPTPTAAPTATPTVTPTITATATPTPPANATPTATAVHSATTAPTATPSAAVAGNIVARDISIVSDTSDPLQHDTATMTLNNTGSVVLSDVTVVYTVVTPVTVANPDGTSSTASQSATTSQFLGAMRPGDVKSVTLKGPDHAKNVPAYTTIKVTWKGGEGTIVQSTIQAPDNTMTTQKF